MKYEEETGVYGIWYDEKTGKKIDDARLQKVKIYVIRLEDWALIDEASFSEQLDYGENGTAAIGMTEVQRYLNDLMK